MQEEVDNRRKRGNDSEEEYDEDLSQSSEANESVDEPFRRPPKNEEPKRPVLIL